MYRVPTTKGICGFSVSTVSSVCLLVSGTTWLVFASMTIKSHEKITYKDERGEQIVGLALKKSF